MKTNLIVFGVIFLVLGVLFYLIPLQEISADTTTNSGGDVDVRTSSAGVNIPVGWAYASVVIGVILTIFGLVLPGPIKTVRGPRGPRGRVQKKRPTVRRARRRLLPKGTSVTKTVTKTRR
ncbi:MAG: hypothetical protein NUV46_00780 [Nanoarchaeota archaeon]|nr:hypothetical protein [Nanoarchaeota archaeon]